MPDVYRNFFTASAGASAAFIGLLFVGLSFIESAEASDGSREWRRIIANSSFVQLVDIFFVSMVGIYADIKSIALVSVIMALLGLISALRLLPQVIELARSGYGLHYSLGVMQTAAYVLQLIIAIKLFLNPTNLNSITYLALAMILLYANALVRAWEITGIKKR